jgi:hypothetical protein
VRDEAAAISPSSYRAEIRALLEAAGPQSVNEIHESLTAHLMTGYSVAGVSGLLATDPAITWDADRALLDITRSYPARAAGAVAQVLADASAPISPQDLHEQCRHSPFEGMAWAPRSGIDRVVAAGVARGEIVILGGRLALARRTRLPLVPERGPLKITATRGYAQLRPGPLRWQHTWQELTTRVRITTQQSQFRWLRMAVAGARFPILVAATDLGESVALVTSMVVDTSRIDLERWEALGWWLWDGDVVNPLETPDEQRFAAEVCGPRVRVVHATFDAAHTGQAVVLALLAAGIEQSFTADLAVETVPAEIADRITAARRTRATGPQLSRCRRCERPLSDPNERRTGVRTMLLAHHRRRGSRRPGTGHLAGRPTPGKQLARAGQPCRVDSPDGGIKHVSKPSRDPPRPTGCRCRPSSRRDRGSACAERSCGGVGRRPADSRPRPVGEVRRRPAPAHQAQLSWLVPATAERIAVASSEVENARAARTQHFLGDGDRGQVSATRAAASDGHAGSTVRRCAITRKHRGSHIRHVRRSSELTRRTLTMRVQRAGGGVPIRSGPVRRTCGGSGRRRARA